MSIEIIGLFTQSPAGEGVGSHFVDFDLDFIQKLLSQYEANDYDRVLIATTASWADSLTIAAYVGANTKKLKMMIAHRPGFINPTMTARMLATIDQLSKGRCGVHIITGANDTEMQSDGDYLPKEHRYRRSAEYTQIMKRIWAEDEPFSHHGEFYKFENARSRVRPIQKTIPVFWGGASGDALQMAAKAADIYAFGIEPLARSKDLIDEVRGYAAAEGREMKFCVSAKAIVGDTEEEAWKKAGEVLDKMQAQFAGKAQGEDGTDLGINARRAELMSMKELQDKRLWLALNKVAGGRGHHTVLVGTGEQVADALLDYYDLGVRCFLFHGYDIHNDPNDYGRSLIPALRAGVAAREAAGAPSLAPA